MDGITFRIYITDSDWLKYNPRLYFYRYKMIEINTTFFPYQLVLYRKQPIELRLKIKNSGTEKVLVSYKMQLPSELSFDKSGFSAIHEEKLGELAPAQTAEQRFEIHPRPLTREGSVEIAIKATEHYNSYEFTMREYKKKVALVIG